MKIVCFVLVAILASCVVESKPVFDHLKRGYEKTLQGLHTLGCKIKNHRGCQDSEEEIDHHIHDIHCGHHHEHTFGTFGQFGVDDDDDFDTVKTLSTAISTTTEEVVTSQPDDVTADDKIDIRFGENESINNADIQDGRHVVNIQSCAAGYRQDRSGQCRKIV